MITITQYLGQHAKSATPAHLKNAAALLAVEAL